MPFSALPVCHAGLISLSKRSHLYWPSVGKSSQTSRQPPCPPLWFRVQREPLVGLARLAGLPVTKPGRLLLGSGKQSSVRVCEHKGHPFLIFSPAPLLSYSRLGKGGENAFGHWLMHCYITYCTIFSVRQEPKFGSLEDASEIFLSKL